MTNPFASTPDLATLRALVHTTLVAPSPLAAFRPPPARRAVEGPIRLSALGEAGLACNVVDVLGPASPERLFRVADAFFGAPHCYSVSVDVEAAPEVDEALRRRGWRLDEEEPALVLPLPASVPPVPPQLTIHRVAGEAELAEFRALSRTGARYIPSLAAATAPGVALFLGYVDGRAVATSRVACMGTAPRKVADINGVATQPEYRRRGFGAAMTWATVAEALRQGCDAAVLTATEMGYPLYKRMGFIPVCTFRTYVPPGALVEATATRSEGSP